MLVLAGLWVAPGRVLAEQLGDSGPRTGSSTDAAALTKSAPPAKPAPPLEPTAPVTPIAPVKRAPPVKRALVVAVDGATRSVIERLSAEGDLPNLAALAEGGASGVLRSFMPLLSPRIWTTVATGMNPSDHGIEGWIHRGKDGEPSLYNSNDRKVPAVWNILERAGHRVGVVNWLMTHPPERIAGVMISDFAVPGTVGRRVQLGEAFAQAMFPDAAGDGDFHVGGGGFAYPPHWQGRFERLLGVRQPLTPFENPFTDEEMLAHPMGQFYNEIFVGDETVARVALEIEETVDPDLLMVYLPGIDRLSHFLFASLVPLADLPQAFRLPAEARRQHSKQLLHHYRFVDAVIGKLVARYDDDDLVIVISDHGFEAPTREGQKFGIHETVAARDGVLYIKGPGIVAGSRAGEMSIADVTPTLLCWFGLGAAVDMSGKCPEFLPFSRPATVASYSGTPIDRTGSDQPDVEQGVLDRLRTLGYVE